MEESSPVYKLYGYGLCKGRNSPPPRKIAENEAQDYSILGTWNFSWMWEFRSTLNVFGWISANGSASDSKLLLLGITSSHR